MGLLAGRFDDLRQPVAPRDRRSRAITRVVLLVPPDTREAKSAEPLARLVEQAIAAGKEFATGYEKLRAAQSADKFNEIVFHVAASRQRPAG
jgi:hypothetical protein